jgi:hypothetical protein
MNISVNRNSNKVSKSLSVALRLAFLGGVSAVSLAFIGGELDGSASSEPVVPAAVQSGPARIYYVTDGQTPHDIAIAESITQQERVLTGIVSPERVVHIIDDSNAGHMSAMEQVLVATGGR